MELKDLAGLSRPLSKLIAVVADGVGAVWGAAMARSFAQARADCRRIEADADRDVALTKVWTDRAAALIHEEAARPATELGSYQRSFGPISPLAERVGDLLLVQGAKRHRNLGVICAEAVRILPDEVSDASVDPDWTARFFENAKDVTSESLQTLWARVLAREVAEPGASSLKTLDVLRNISRREAEIFQRLCSGLVDGSSLPRWERGRFQTHFGTEYVEYLEMIELGLLSSEDSTYYVEPDEAANLPEVGVKKGELLIRGWKVSFVYTKRRASLDCVVLTRAGRELASIAVSPPLSREYVDWVASGLKGVKDIAISPHTG